MFHPDKQGIYRDSQATHLDLQATPSSTLATTLLSASQTWQFPYYPGQIVFPRRKQMGILQVGNVTTANNSPMSLGIADPIEM